MCQECKKSSFLILLWYSPTEFYIVVRSPALLIIERVFNKDLGYESFLLGCPSSLEVSLINIGFGKMPFEDLICRENWVVTHVLDTHLSSCYLQGGLCFAREVGAIYIAPHIQDTTQMPSCLKKAFHGQTFYVGEVRVDVSVHEREATYTFKGGVICSISKKGKVEKGSRKYAVEDLLYQQQDRLIAAAEQNKESPYEYYGASIYHFNANFIQPLKRETKALSPEMFHQYLQRGRQVVDLRHGVDFEKQCIPGSIFIGQSYISSWAPYLIDCRKKIILIGEEYLSMQKCIEAFGLLGVFDVEGYLDSTLESWRHLGYDLMSIESLDRESFFNMDFDLIIDVRTENEVAHQEIDGAINIPLSSLYDHKQIFEKKKCGFFCSGGVRSLMAASIALNFGAASCKHLRKGILPTQISFADK